MSNEWWKKEIAYQIYPKSFKDSNGDGIGDLRGIIEKLDYLEDLGVTLLWLCPIYKSPMDDNGYDISDYYDINPEFGTMADLEELIEKAKNKGIKIIMDLVINHSSDEHAWFQEALKDPNSPYHDYYIFKSSKDGKEPNNWRSVFGGSVWQKVEGRDEYYFHAFSKKQPDLNWENPALRQELYKMINWWLDKGIAGFRVDAINFIKKDQRFLDGPVDGQDGLSACFAYSRNQPGIEVFFDELKKETFEKHNCMTVAEAVGVQYKDLGIFIGKDGCFSMMFDFNYCNFDISEDEEWFKRNDWTVKQFKELLFTSQREVQKLGWIASFLENHDQPRAIDKFVLDKKNHNYYSQTMLAGMFFNLRGTPFIYQGEEIGMTNHYFTDIHQYQDVESINAYHILKEQGINEKEIYKILQEKSRDNARTPMQWNNTENGGFSKAKPWLQTNDNYKEINVENDLKDPDSIFKFYQQLIQLRKKYSIISEGTYEPYLENHPSVFAYKRHYQNEELVVFNNFYGKETTVELENINEYKVLISNYKEHDLKDTLTLKPYETIALYK